jgi:hypothetical protein
MNWEVNNHDTAVSNSFRNEKKIDQLMKQVSEDMDSSNAADADEDNNKLTSFGLSAHRLV